MLDKEAALFAPSGPVESAGTFAHCDRGDEYLVGTTRTRFAMKVVELPYWAAFHPSHCPGIDGTLALDDLEAAIKPADFHFARSRVICLENTHAGEPFHRLQRPSPPWVNGGVWPRIWMARDCSMRRSRKINACGSGALRYRICLFVKRLGRSGRVGLAGSQALIDEARRWRKVLGGGMRQAGIIAAAGLYALEHQISDLAQDHKHADQLASCLR